MSDIAVQENKQVSVSGETSALINMIERVCLDPQANIEKLEKMLDMQERILDRNAKQAFTADLAAMQIELPRVVENGKGHNNAKYAKLEDISDAIRPVMNKYGFAVTFSIDQQQNQVTVIARLSHRMGYSDETKLCLPLDTSGNKNAVQAAGSTISYGKRYAICALLNISTGDDVDGNINHDDPAYDQKPVVGENEIKQLRDAMVIANLTEKNFCRAARIAKIEDLELWRFATAMELIKNKAEKNVNN